MNGIEGETALAILGLGNLGWLVLLAFGRIKTAGPVRKTADGATAPPARTSSASKQPRGAGGRFVPKAEPLHEAGTEAA